MSSNVEFPGIRLQRRPAVIPEFGRAICGNVTELGLSGCYLQTPGSL